MRARFDNGPGPKSRSREVARIADPEQLKRERQQRYKARVQEWKVLNGFHEPMAGMGTEQKLVE